MAFCNIAKMELIADMFYCEFIQNKIERLERLLERSIQKS